MTILALETSCDDTCAAVIGGDGVIRSNVISSQRAHDRFGGVVPEIASRHHLEIVNLVVEQSLAEAHTTLDGVDLVAVTQGPGLVGALLVGLSTAKGLAAGRELPLAAIDHLQGHVAANFLAADGDRAGAPKRLTGAPDGSTGAPDASAGALGGAAGALGGAAGALGGAAGALGGAAGALGGATSALGGVTGAPDVATSVPGGATGEDGASPGGDGPREVFEPPFLCLIASGGHTLLAHVRDYEGFHTLGRTLDDAAGEAFDKGARMLGLGYPGGPALERLAADGDPSGFEFPASGSRLRGGRGATSAFARGLDFSFAGLKTSLLYQLRELSEEQRRERAPDLAASYQAAIVDHLMLRAEQALELTGLDRLAVGGGVAANGELRGRLQRLGGKVHVPPRVLCTDNAAMIGSAARFATALPYPEYLGLDAYATGERPR
jgi:N6-L-threonylcarbamoyladenine synthase